MSGDESNASSRVLYFFTDIFGIALINNRLLCDLFAEKGFYVIMPDLFDGDAIPEDAMNPGKHVDFGALLAAWGVNHSVANIDPIIAKVVKQIRADYSPKFSASVGYCFGAKYTVRLLAEDGVLQSAGIFHPSRITMEEVEAIKGEGQTLFICSPDNDGSYTKELRSKTEDHLKVLADSTGFRYKTVLLHGVGHGFAVRGDIRDPWVKYSKERAFIESVDWFKGSESLLA